MTGALAKSDSVEPAYKDIPRNSDLISIIETFMENLAIWIPPSIALSLSQKELKPDDVSIILIKLQPKHILIGRFDCSV
jgi:hypothetical protein